MRTAIKRCCDGPSDGRAGGWWRGLADWLAGGRAVCKVKTEGGARAFNLAFTNNRTGGRMWMKSFFPPGFEV